MDIFTNKIIQKAFEKVCHRRKEYGHNSDIWDLRHNWNTRKPDILDGLNDGTYKFDAVRELLIDGEIYEIWAAEDAVVIEALTMLLKDNYNMIEDCDSYHLKGRGGVKAALNQVENNLDRYKFVMKSDVKKYYASMDHDVLMDLIREYVTDSPVTQLIYQFLKRVKYRDGYYLKIRRGICRGTALSPLLGALYLKELDNAIGKMNVTYVRFMDDWVVMSTNKWTFGRAIKKVNRVLNDLKLEKTYDKTFIGKIDRGFDFLGFRFSREGRCLAEETVRKFAENIVQKLETCKTEDTGKITPVIPVGKRRSGSAFGTWRFQDKNEKGDLPVPETVSAYIRRWLIWVKSICGKGNFEILDTEGT